MNQSESIAKLAAALVKAQSEMPEIPMDGLNPHYKSKFSTLGAVIKATRPVFTANGLCVLQLPSGEAGEVGLTTRIVHVSGEWIEAELVMAVSGTNPGQEVGKLVTYLRRYALASAAGVYSDEDTDNEGPKTKKAEPKEQDESLLPKDSRPWSVAQKNALIKAELAKNDFAARGMLGLSMLPIDASPNEIVAWGKVYRGYRETMLAADAAQKANDEVFNVS